MEEALSALIGRISNYNLLNNLIPGAILCVLLKYLVGYDFIVDGTIELLVVFYFVGMVNGRVGSLAVEWLLVHCGLVTRRDHKLYVEAEQKDKKITSLSETNNMYRSIISVSLLSLLMKLYRSIFELNGDFAAVSEWVLLVALLIIFVLAYIKQTRYIVSRIDYHAKKS